YEEIIKGKLLIKTVIAERITMSPTEGHYICIVSEYDLTLCNCGEEMNPGPISTTTNCTARPSNQTHFLSRSFFSTFQSDTDESQFK
ncbi:hypothetical protein L9F63_020972, partial [Diploptera punctata]